MGRATSKEAKLEKANFILEKSFELYKRKNYKEFTFDQLKEVCGVSKGIIFKYFRTKEILFSTMLTVEYYHRYDYIEKLISTYNSNLSNDDLRDLFLSLLENDLYENVTFRRLLNIKSAILDKSTDYESIRKMKSAIHHRYSQILADISVKSNLSKTDLNLIFMTHNAFLSGALQSTMVSKVVQEVIENEDLKYFQVDPKKHALATYQLYLNKVLDV